MNRTDLYSRLASAALAIALLLLLCGCMQPELTSTWLDREITIDGKASEWAGREAYYGEDEGLKAGFSNDDRYLYVYFATWHKQTQMQILMNGLTVWIDARGGKKEVFGVMYPVETSPGEMPESRPDFSKAAPDRQRGDPAVIGDLLNRARTELRLLGPNKEPIASFSATDTSETDIEAMVDVANRTLIYELKFPLATPSGPPYAISAGPGATIGIGLKVGEKQMPNMKRQGQNPPEGIEGGPGGTGGGRPGGGGRGTGGPPGGGMGAPGGMGGAAATEPLELWVKVKLAARPTTTTQK